MSSLGGPTLKKNKKKTYMITTVSTLGISVLWLVAGILSAASL